MRPTTATTLSIATHAAAAIVIGALANAATPALVGASVTTPDFCVRVQQQLVGTSMIAQNVVDTDYDAFVKSKPVVRPLQIHQYVWPESAISAKPMRISCKSKSADHLNSAYGAGTAMGEMATCRDVIRSTVLAVYAALPAADRARVKLPPQQIMLDPDERAYVGSKWLAPYTFAYTGADGKLHLRGKTLLAEWDDWRWKIMPERFRGNHYCHLIAPEYVRRLMLGEVKPEMSAPKE